MAVGPNNGMDGVFLWKMWLQFVGRKSGGNNEVSVSQGSTVVKDYMIMGLIKIVGKKEILIKLTYLSIER